MNRLLLLLTFVFLASTLVVAQPGRFFLRGLVMKERKAIDGAIVRVYESNTLVDSTFSKNGGKYFLELPLNKKYLIQFYFKGFAPKNISVETRVGDAMSAADFDKYMVVALEEMTPLTLQRELQPVVQFKFNTAGEMVEAGEQFLPVPDIVPYEDKYSILNQNANASAEAQRILDEARKKARLWEATATATLDSARKQAYRIIYNAEVVARQNNTTTTKPQIIRDTIYIDKASTESLIRVKAEEKQRVNSLQTELERKQAALALQRQQLEIERLNAQSVRDSMRLTEIDNAIRVAEGEITNLVEEIEDAQEKIRLKDLQIEARELQNRNLRLTVWFISILAVLILVFFVITYRNYKAKRRLADELKLINAELTKLSIIVSETDNAVILYDLEGNLEWVNKGFTRMYGYEVEDLEAEKLDNIFLRKDRDATARYYERVVANSKQVSFESRARHKSGAEVWTQSTLTPIVDNEGKLFKVASIESDVTQRKYAEIEIKKQKEKLELHNRMMQDSIRYAHTIQAAFLPTDLDLRSVFDCFALNRPKDIVSGDFIWLMKQNVGESCYTFVAAVDCTGHGVPGAFMSMIGNRLLTEIVVSMQIYDPGQILDQLDKEVQKALKQDTTENSDGMDVCLCRLEYIDDTCTILFAGAQRPLIHYQAQTCSIQKLKGDIKTAGGFLSSFIDKRFSSQPLLAHKGDMIYLTTDGIFDQNGPDRRRLGSKRINEIIEQYAHQDVAVQHAAFVRVLDEYQGDAEQRDDITLLGIRI